MAKSLAWSRGIPLVPVDHIAAHVDAVFLRDSQGAGERRPEFPYVALAVSGGHTSLMLMSRPGSCELLGRTLDDAAGEAFDKLGKMMGLPYPGGVQIDRMAQHGARDSVVLPRPMLSKGLDFSFSGLKTAARYHMEGLGPAGPFAGDEQSRFDLAASFQEAVVTVLVTKAIRACRSSAVPRLVLAGGVACNSRLREALTAEAERAGIDAYIAPPRYCSDNAAMIGGLGLALLERRQACEGAEILSLDIYTRQGQQPL